MPINLITKNFPYNGVRAVITASQSGTPYTYFVEGSGQRYYVSPIGSTYSQMESASFESFLSFTMSGFATYSVDLIPMQSGESVMIDTHVLAMNSSGSKAYTARVFGGFRHSGATLSAIGGSLDINTKSDFSTVAISFTNSATASVRMRIVGQTSENLDWDIHVSYTKGYHSISATASNANKPIYPKPNNPTS